MAQGAADELVDAKGHKLRLLRHYLRNLKTIETPNRRHLTLTVDIQGRVVRAEDQEQHRVDYSYGPAGVLTDVSYADGRARHYTYDGPLLMSVRDEAGRLLIDNTYSRRKLVRQTYANGTSWSIRYDVAPNGLYATRAVVETSDGARHEIPTEDFVTRWIRNSGQGRE
jgi:uncharacterized protein RhaS with RHS repeats